MSAPLLQRAAELEAQAVASRDPRAEAHVLAELARVRLSLGDAEQALLALARALHLAPDDASLLEGLESMSDRALVADVLADLATDAPVSARPLVEAALARVKP